MKGLNKNEIYDLAELSISQLKELNIYLNEFCDKWELFTEEELREFSRQESLFYSNFSKRWLISEHLEFTKCATELFK